MSAAILLLFLSWCRDKLHRWWLQRRAQSSWLYTSYTVLCQLWWSIFSFWFMECDLGYDWGLRASVGKRSPEYSTRSPFFLAAMGSTCKQGKPNGNQKREGSTLTLGRNDPKSEGSPSWRRPTMRDAYLLLRQRGKGQPILLIIRKGVRWATVSLLPRRPGRKESRVLCRCWLGSRVTKKGAQKWRAVEASSRL